MNDDDTWALRNATTLMEEYIGNATVRNYSSWSMETDSDTPSFQKQIENLQKKVALQNTIIEAHTDEMQVLKKRIADLEKGE